MRALFAVFLGGLSACSLLFPVDDLTGGTIATEAGTPTDGAIADGAKPGSDATAPDGALADAGPVNVFPNGSFEEDGGDCLTGWANTGIVATRVAGGHDGQWACQLCATDAGAGQITAWEYYPPIHAAAQGETWQSRAWVRAVGTTQQMEARLRLYDKGQFKLQTFGGKQTVDTTWREISVDISAASQSYDRLDPYWVSFPAAAGECYLIDDIRLFRTVP